MDSFVECIVKKKIDNKNIFIIAMAICLTFLLIFISTLFWNILSVLSPLIWAGAIYVCYYIISIQNVEYEYTITNNQLDIDKIIHKRKRIRLLSLDVRSIEKVSPNESASYQKILMYASSLSSANLYCAIYVDDGVRTKLIFEPNDGMKKALKALIPRRFDEL